MFTAPKKAKLTYAILDNSGKKINLFELFFELELISPLSHSQTIFTGIPLISSLVTASRTGAHAHMITMLCGINVYFFRGEFF